MSKHPFGIGFRLFSGTGLITLVAIIVATTFILVAGRFQGNFQSITEKNLPAITAAAQLSRLSNSIASQGPWMYAANSEWARQTAYSRALDEANWLENLLNEADNTAIDAETKAVFLDLSRRLLERYAELDGLTRQRIAIARSLEEAQNRVEALLPKLAEATTTAPKQSVWGEWAHNSHTLLRDLLAALHQPHQAPLAQLQAAATNHLDDLEAQFAALPKADVTALKPLRDDFLAVATGDRSVFRLRARQIEVNDDIGSTLESIASIADEFLAVSSNTTYNITNTLEAEARIRSQELETLSNSVMVLVVFCAVMAATLFVYIYRQVIVRLRRLQDSIQAQAQGHGVEAIDLGGEDELGEVARGLDYFVNAIRSREDALLSAKNQAERASTAKTNFLASASHDLRQPLQALNLFVAALDDQEDDEAKSRLIDRIKDSLGALGSLLDSLLDVSKLEAGLVVPEPEAFPLSLILTRLNEEFTQVAHAKGLKFKTFNGPMMVYSDPTLLETILRNLINNAIKYTNDGGILVGYRKRGKNLELEIWDTGVGIPDEQRNLIFHDFYQINNPIRDRSQGLGLGLSIVDRLARLLQCRIALQSRPGKGSVFKVSVPLAEAVGAQPAEVRPLIEDDTSEAFIVIIDDEIDILEGMGMVLDAWGYQTLGLPCVKCKQCDERLLKLHRVPDLLIVDYRLAKDMNGIEAIQLIRDWFHVEIPAMLITGDTAPDRLRDVQDSGLPVLNKPVQAQDLRMKIEELLQG